MQHIVTFEDLARHHVEQRVREAAHEAQLRLAREANAVHRPNATARVRCCVACTTGASLGGFTPGCAG